MEDLLTIDEIAKRFNVPKSWLYTKTRTKEIPFYKLGKYCRFSASEIREWLQAQKQG